MSMLLNSLRESYDIVDAAIKEAVENSRSSQGMASLIKQRVDIAIKIDEEEARERLAGDDTIDEHLTDEELIALQVEDLCALPDALLDRILSGVAEQRPGSASRSGLRRLEVVGGRDTE